MYLNIACCYDTIKGTDNTSALDILGAMLGFYTED